MIEMGKNLEGVEGCGAEGERSGQGYFPPQWGWGLVRGLCPLRRKFLRFLPENGAFWLHFLPYTRFFLQFKGGGHGPSGPMVNTPLSLRLRHIQSTDVNDRLCNVYY